VGRPELLARHIDGGVIEMGHEGDHAFAAGYDGPRAIRTWRERMRVLEKLGFIRTRGAGNQDFKYVLLVHPTTALQRLRDAVKVPDHWWIPIARGNSKPKRPLTKQGLPRTKPRK